MKDALAFLSAALVMMLIIHCNVVREQGRLITPPAIGQNYFSVGPHSSAAPNTHTAPLLPDSNDERYLTATLESTNPLTRSETTHAFQDARAVVRNGNSRTAEISNLPGVQPTIENPLRAPTESHEEESQCDLRAWIGPIGTESTP